MRGVEAFVGLLDVPQVTRIAGADPLRFAQVRTAGVVRPLDEGVDLRVDRAQKALLGVLRAGDRAQHAEHLARPGDAADGCGVAGHRVGQAAPLTEDRHGLRVVERLQVVGPRVGLQGTPLNPSCCFTHLLVGPLVEPLEGIARLVLDGGRGGRVPRCCVRPAVELLQCTADLVRDGSTGCRVHVPRVCTVAPSRAVYGSIVATPLSATCSVHIAPSKYRYSCRPVGHATIWLRS